MCVLIRDFSKSEIPGLWLYEVRCMISCRSVQDAWQSTTDRDFLVPRRKWEETVHGASSSTTETNYSRWHIWICVFYPRFLEIRNLWILILWRCVYNIVPKWVWHTSTLGRVWQVVLLQKTDILKCHIISSQFFNPIQFKKKSTMKIISAITAALSMGFSNGMYLIYVCHDR